MVKQYFKYYEVVDYSAGSVFKEGYKSNKDVPNGTPLFHQGVIAVIVELDGGGGGVHR